MNIPIFFSFNDNFTLPAGVCITSLLENADQDTFYDIYILYSNRRLKKNNIEKISLLEKEYQNCSISFLDLEDEFKDSFSNRHITIDTYYRLLIPYLIDNYDKVIYADVDIIFRKDLTELYSTELGKSAIGASVSLNKPRKIKNYSYFAPGTYFNAGFLLMDLSEFRKIQDYKEKIAKLTMERFEFHDQDILNILFQGKVKFLPIKYNLSRSCLGSADTEEVRNNFREPVVIHYTGGKPWNGFISLKSDEWWDYYCRSIYYEPGYYAGYIKGYKDLEDLRNKDKILKKIGFNIFYKGLKQIISFVRSQRNRE